jgi:hypothetical protein
MAKKKAELIFFERVHYQDGAILEMKLWRVPLGAAFGAPI